MLRLSCLLFGLLCFQSVSAQEPTDPKCADRWVRDRCQPETQARIRAVYGLPDIETLAAEGSEVRRVMVFGANREQVAVSFIRPKGQDPVVEVRGVVWAWEKKRPARVVRMPISLATWEKIAKADRYFDRDLVRLPGEEPIVCLDGGSVTVEVAAAKGQGSQMRNKSQSSCTHGLAFQYA